MNLCIIARFPKSGETLKLSILSYSGNTIMGSHNGVHVFGGYTTDINNVKGEIYIIICKVTGKFYVGKTQTHRMNMGQYKPFGTIGRFKDHVSEAICNKKPKQCTYLNNAIRKYGPEAFVSIRLMYCELNDVYNYEQKLIEAYGSLYPYGYNLTIGGKNPTVSVESKASMKTKLFQYFIDQSMPKINTKITADFNKYIKTGYSLKTKLPSIVYVTIGDKKFQFAGRGSYQEKLNRANEFLRQVLSKQSNNCLDIPKG